MDSQRFWQEEMRRFPHGGEGAALWVARMRGDGGAGGGRAREEGLVARPPLGAMLRVVSSAREEFRDQDGDEALWVEPLLAGDRARGCLAVWFDAARAWRESVFLWAQELAPRLGAMLGQLSPVLPGTTCPSRPGQPTLFPLPPVVDVRGGETEPRATVPLPRPAVVPGIPACVGASREMRDLGRRLGPVARSGVNVLLRGESGTGKEVVARALHECSDRRRGPFVGQNCAALPESLFESELFGHRAGAFTGAAGDKQGLLSSADRGTFFLDEIGDMPVALQIKLLRVMQERRVRRIGELRSRPVDIRFVAATHRDLAEEVARGGFRLDLFYRLKVVCLEIPALRHRPEDVAHLFAWFLRRNGVAEGTRRISERALAALQAWRWPGNVRELENEVLRWCALHGQEPVIRTGHLSPEIQAARSGRAVRAADLGTLRPLEQANEILERYLIRKAIAATEGRKAAAARRLGLSRQGLYKKIARYGMSDLIKPAAARG
jgi:transcriptional regulator with AAA-type ATPase domain